MPPGTLESYFAAKPKPTPPSEAPAPAPAAQPATSVAPAPAPAAPAAVKHDSIDAKEKEVDIEQQFIDYFLSKAVNPKWRGKQLKGRRVAVFGKKYYWGEDATYDIKFLPQSFKKWCKMNKYKDYNSFLVNVYMDASDNIGWHMDDTTNLAHGEVASVSFATKPSDRDKTLAAMEFRYPNKKEASGAKTIKKESLKHGTVVRFDAHKHKKTSCEHRVPKTLCARVNVTMRRLR
jgi:hypothetical protein